MDDLLNLRRGHTVHGESLGRLGNISWESVVGRDAELMGEYVRYAHTLVAQATESIIDVGSHMTLRPVLLQILDPDFCVSNAFFALDHLVAEKCPHFWIVWFGIILLFSLFQFSFGCADHNSWD